MLDSVQGRGPSMAFMPYCSLPELESAMEVWGFMEMIHSRSYTHIIKNLYANPEEIFSTITTDDRILQRAKKRLRAATTALSMKHFLTPKEDGNTPETVQDLLKMNGMS